MFASILAREFKEPDIDKLLDSLSWSQFVEWKAIYRLDPFGEKRADYRAAVVAFTVASYAAFTKGKDKLKFENFMLNFDRPNDELTVQDEEKHLAQLRSLETWMMVQASHIIDKDGNKVANPNHVGGGKPVPREAKEQNLREVPDNQGQLAAREMPNNEELLRKARG